MGYKSRSLILVFVFMLFFLFLHSSVYAAALSGSLASSTHSASSWSNTNKITVTWTKPSADSTYGNVVGYSIKWDTTSTTVPDTSIELDSNATTTTSNALSDGQSIYFHIRVIYDGGSPLAADHLGPFWVDATAPSAASSFTITKGDAKLTLNWTNPGDTDFAGVVIRRDTASYPTSATSGSSVATITSSTYAAGAVANTVDSGLTNGQTYYYSIFAYDERSGQSANRNYSSATQANSKPEATGGTTAPPTVSSTNPSSNGTDVALDSTINIVFDKDMQSSTIDSNTFTVKDSSNNAVTGTIAYTSSPPTAKFTPSSALNYGSTYTVTLLSGTNGVKDTQSNGLDGNGNSTAQDAPTDNYSFTFTTIVPPKVSSSTPASAATGVSQTASINITFSKAMDSASISSSTITIKQDTTDVTSNGTISYNSTDKTATFTLTSGSYTKGAVITVTIKAGTSGVKDANGIALDVNGDGKLDTNDNADKTISFTIISTISHNITLATGWNLISMPIDPTNTATATVLSALSGKYSVVWAYIGGSWKLYDPGDVEGSTLTTMEAGKGYWIKMTSADTLTITGNTASTSVSLASGWNLVGYNKTASDTATNVLAGIANKYTVVWAYIGGSWKLYDPGDVEGSTITQFSASYGYWIKTTQAATWTLP